MPARLLYEMTEEDHRELIEACKPVPAMFLSGGTPMFGTPQENANRAWAKLGKKMGFEPMTVRPGDTSRPRTFTAEPTETDAERKHREDQTWLDQKRARLREIDRERATVEAEIRERGAQP